MGARGANEIGEECRELIAHSSPKDKLAETELRCYMLPRLTKTLPLGPMRTQLISVR
jgi:hypothetical protein